MNINNDIIQSLWIGDKLTNNEMLCLRSYIYHGHDFHLYVYDDTLLVPPGIQLMDASKIIPKSGLFKDTANTFASFADWFRLKLLYEKGGWWVDMDTVCIKRFDIAGEFCFSSELNFDRKFSDINNTYIKSPPHARFLSELIGIIEDKVNSGDPVNWGETGVYLFRTNFSDYPELAQYVQDYNVFCPLHYFDTSSLICPEKTGLNETVMAVHLWNEIWRRGYLDKNGIYHGSSIYEKLKKCYNVR